jgi:MFS family permease
MLITRKKQIPLHWVFYAQLPFVMSIAANYITGAPFLYAMKKFIDNPAAITFLLSIEVFITMLGGPFVSWLSDRVWTRYGRRRMFIVAADIPKALVVFAMPFAPDLITLICLRWAYGILADLSSPNQALTMEVVPTKQRGMGSGFFKLQGQVVNLFFFLLVVGRFDDVYFTGPLHALFAVDGETLTFAAGAILFLAISFYTWFGIHEVEPPTHKTVRDEQKPGESLVRLFLRTFFRDIFHRSLLPLYLLMFVGTLTGVSLGILGPLLYTEQWGYSLQEMGTNIAIGAVIGIGVSVLAGWIADKTSKMKVYTAGLILALLTRIFWTIYVANKPGDRPELYEILLFGTITSVFSLIASAASFPLILEYVERNRLGTAGAGMGLFNSVVKNSFTMLAGFLLLWWSLFFLPQAGDRVQLVFRESFDAPALVSRLTAAGYAPDELDLAPVHRPGSDGDTSRHWKIRRPVASAGDAHKQLKDLDTEVSKLQLKLQRPNLAPATKTELDTQLADLRAQQARIKASLAESTASFESDMLRVFAADVVAPGSHILAAASSADGTRLDLTLEFVEPVTTDITPRSFREILGLQAAPRIPKTVTQEFARVIETNDLNRIPSGTPGEYLAELSAVPAAAPLNAIALTLHRDPDFVALENAFASAGASAASAYTTTSTLLSPLRGLGTQSSASYALSAIEAGLDRVAFDLTLQPPPDSTVPTAAAVTDAFKRLKTVTDVLVEDRPGGAFRVALTLKPLPAAPADAPLSANAARLRELLPDASPHDIRALETVAQRAIETAAARPVFLTSARPVVLAKPADREYDYFFPMQYFMIITDVFGLMIIVLIVRLEKSGRIVRLGALEDANR